MSFLLWQRESGVAIASARLVLRAGEVPALRDAQQMRAELDSLRRDQQAHVQAACSAAHAEGLAAGLQEGRAQARDELAATLAALSTAAAQHEAQRRADVAALALQVARKLLGELDDGQRLAALAREAAREMLPAPRLTVRVHPQRSDAVRAQLQRMAARADSDSGVAFEVVADDGCAPDDCRIDSELGSADASLDQQLVRLAQAWGVSAR
ncbi:MAG TPA: FliH/SctL family protein [Burkholderiaceae bacterium]|nr:FliH/SctL family protein [Burkholderiaceae bacterium]